MPILCQWQTKMTMESYFAPHHHALPRKQFHRKLFLAAGAYNLIWGAYSLIDPGWLFRLADMSPARYPQLFACMAMVVGLYGFVYLEIARAPERGWLLAAIGLLGKIAGPIGMIYLIVSGQWKLGAIWLCVTNDFIWWLPFSMYLRDAWPFFRDDLAGSNAPLALNGEKSLYHHILQQNYLSLAPDIQQFHNGQFQGRGIFTVQAAPGLISRLFRAMAPLPPVGENTPVNLNIVSGSCFEQWNRLFANHLFPSIQYARQDGLLAERSGWMEIRFTLQAINGALHYRSQSLHLCLGPYRLPLPQLFSVYAAEKPTSTRGTVEVNVQIDDFRGQRLFQYFGQLNHHQVESIHG